MIDPDVVIIPGNFGTGGAKGDPGSPGEGYPTRGAMAARLAPALLDDVYLTEVGREGKFVVDLASNWTAQIAADTAQARFVASTADAAKVYVRKSDGPPSARHAGAVADNSTSNHAAIVAAIAASAASPVYLSGIGYGVGIGRLSFPVGAYYVEDTTDITFTLSSEGDGTGSPGGLSTIIRVPSGKHGFRVQFYNTTGDSGIIASPPSPAQTGAGSRFRGLGVVGPGFNGTTLLETENHAWFLRANALIDDCQSWNMPGDGIHIHAGVGLPEGGGANCWSIFRHLSQGCRTAFFSDASDTNHGVSYQLTTLTARQFGISDHSGIRNVHLAPLAQLVGVWGDGTAGNPAGMVHKSGHHYCVRRNQDAAASITSPSGTTDSTTEWIYFEDGGIVTPGCPDWYSGIHVRQAGPIDCAGGIFVENYEEGDQPISQAGTASLFLGGTYGGLRPLGGNFVEAGGNNVLISSIDLFAGGLNIRDNVFGTVSIGAYSPGNPGIITTAASALAISADGAQELLLSSANVQVNPASGHGWLISAAGGEGGLRPMVDNVDDIGHSSFRVANIRLANNPIVTSDVRMKQQLRPLSDPGFDKLLDAVEATALHAFKYNDAVDLKGGKARDHYGIAAQHLHDELVKRGLDPFAGGVLCQDPELENYEEEVEVEQAKMRDEFREEEKIELVDGKAVLTRVLTKIQVPDIERVPVHAPDGSPVMVHHGRKAGMHDIPDNKGGTVRRWLHEIPPRQRIHEVQRTEIVRKSEKRTRHKQVDGVPQYRLGLRYDQFHTLCIAALRRSAPEKAK